MFAFRVALLSVCVFPGCHALAEMCASAPDIQITTEDIFDLSNENTHWFQHVANSLNIVTLPETVANEVAFLKEKCDINDNDLAEVERYLRKLRYINTAKAEFLEDGNVAITTSDKWTLMPTLDFGRKGGVNKYTIGIKDHNLLGYGIDAEIGYFKDAQRSGYLLDIGFPFFTGDNLYGTVTLADTDDGSLQGVSVVRPFVSFDTDNAFTFSVYRGDLSQQYFLSGQDYYSLNFSDRSALASWGTRIYRGADSVFRMTYGVSYEQRTFSDLNSDFDVFAPRDREYFTPFVKVEYVQDHFRELSNVRLINQIEDFNFGWRFQTTLGVNVASRDHDESLFVADVEISKGTQLSPSMLLLSDLSLVSNVGSTSRSRYVMNLNNELFYTLSPAFGLYGAHHLTFSKNQFYDLPVVIGEENGVRGYPLEFQRGNSRVTLTGELRYYPNINIYDLFDVGAAVFVDAGRVYGTDDFEPQKAQWLSSVGLGARFYSRQAADANVIHVDVSFPMLGDDNVNNVEFMLSTKSSF